MPNERGIFHQQLILGVGTLGGIAFAALILVLSNEYGFTRGSPLPSISPHLYYDILIASLSFLSGLCMFSCLIMSFTAANIFEEKGPVGVLATVSSMLCFGGFLFEIPLLIASFSPKTGTYMLYAIFVLFVVFGVAVLFDSLRKRSLKRNATMNKTRANAPSKT